jgi:hypothetical protein
MGIQTWRRHHGRDLTADVVELEPMTYSVEACHQPSGVVRRLPKTFQRLESAKAAADDFVRRSFGHACTMESCGAWLIWSG